MEIPDSFLAKVARQFGGPGEAWGRELPSIVDRCRDAWRLEQCVPVAELSINFVCLCRSAIHGETVLKLNGPHSERWSEIEAMRLFDGRHLCPLLASDWDSAAMLLRRVQPGTSLRALPDRDRQLAIGAEMIGKVPLRVTSAHHLPSYGDWIEIAARNIRQGDGPRVLQGQLHAAREMYRGLDPDGAPQVLLHGDLHHDNILRSGPDGWVVIDPQGVIGPAFMEAGRFIQNHSVYEPGPVDVENLLRTVRSIAGALAYPSATMFRAFLILHVLSCCWDWEMHGDPADIERGEEQCARLFDLAGERLD